MSAWPKHLEDPYAWNEAICPVAADSGYRGGMLEGLYDLGAGLRLFSKSLIMTNGVLTERTADNKLNFCEIARIEWQPVAYGLQAVKALQIILPWAYYAPASIEFLTTQWDGDTYVHCITIEWKSPPDSASSLEWKYGVDIWASTRHKR